MSSKYDDGYRKRSVSKQLAPGFVGLQNPVTSQDINWTKNASCRGMDVSLFFPENGHSVSKEVRELCNSCPVRTDCYIYAERNKFDADGVFGGYSPRQRHEMRKVKGRNSTKFQQISS
jgi:hypothetical protein